MTNLLEIIKNDKDHPFHNQVIISEDYKRIKTFNGRNVVIYGDKTYLEALAREIIVNVLIKDQKRFYKEEERNEQNNRIDLVSQCLFDHQVQSMIEFKNMDCEQSTNQTDKMLEQAFDQMHSLYIKGQPHQNQDFYTTVIMTDIKKLVNNPLLLERFMTISNDKKLSHGIELFKEFGIYIETRKYNSIGSGFIDNSKKWYQIPKHCIFELSPQKDVFGEKSKICKVKNAIYLPSSSSEFGIKNVRDIKDPEMFTPKRVLVKDILDTLIEAFNLKDKNLLANNGKEKDFVYIENETIIQIRNYEEEKKFAVVTLNGAIVDGQNSLDALKRIVHIVDCVLRNQTLDTKFEESIAYKVRESGFNNKEVLEQFKQFILESHVLIKTTTCRDVRKARDIAISKNNTMEVTKNELTMSENIEKIQYLSNQVLLKSDYIIGYPKKENFGISKKMLDKNMIMADNVAQYFKNYRHIIKSVVLGTKEIFNIIQRLNKEDAVYDLNLLTNVFVNEIDVNNKSKGLTKDSADLQALKERIKQINIMQKSFKDDLEKRFNPSDREYIELKIEELNGEEKMLKAEQTILKTKLDNNKPTRYVVSDIDVLINLLASICKLREVIAKSDFMNNYPKDSIIHKNSVHSLLFVLIVYKTKTDLKTSFTEEMCIDMLNRLPIAMAYLTNTYPSGITDIRNSKEGFVVNVDGVSVPKEQARQEFLDFFLKD